jgi:hypothetical protein
MRNRELWIMETNPSASKRVSERIYTKQLGTLSILTRKVFQACCAIALKPFLQLDANNLKIKLFEQLQRQKY